MFILPFPNPITAAGRSRSVLFQTKVAEINSSTKSFLSFFVLLLSSIRPTKRSGGGLLLY